MRLRLPALLLQTCVAVAAQAQVILPPPPLSKATIDYPTETLAVSDPGGVDWIKFAIRVGVPSSIVFQDGSRFPLHFDFATAELDPYVGIDPAGFEAVSFHADGQELVLGTVLYRTTAGSPLPEVAIQLVRGDPYTVDEVELYFETARAAIRDPNGTSPPALYVPTFEQQPSAVANAAALAERGIVVRDAASWLEGGASPTYVEGWALGKIVEVPSTGIAAAYAAGSLLPDDILLTDAVPAEIPFVVGVLTRSPATPNSHVAILSRDWRTPFAYLDTQQAVDAVEQSVGERVLLRVPRSSLSLDPGVPQRFALWAADGLSIALQTELVARRQPRPVVIEPMAVLGAYSASVEDLSPDDLRFFGGKASGYGLVREAVPDASRFAIALSFDLWMDFLAQPMPSGMTLSEEIAAQLAPFDSHPPDFAALADALAWVRERIEDDTVFTAAQVSAIESALSPFDASRKLRFRSSSNAEDGEFFTGAGLYDSFSGCLADDLDDDASGPSLCDAAHEKERGVFRAIRKVFASFYNDNAFLERLRRGIDEETVGMAVLVHHSFPDETELANGVAEMSPPGLAGLRVGVFVTQPGAASVANPGSSALPEIARVRRYSFGTPPNDTVIELLQASQLLPAGQATMNLPNDYRTLHVALSDVADAFGAHHHRSDLALELEYKKIDGEGLIVKQVRPKPAPDPEQAFPLLVEGSGARCGYTDLRSRFCLSIETDLFDLDPARLGSELYETLQLDVVTGPDTASASGALADLPLASHEVSEPQQGRTTITDTFRADALGADITLMTRLPAAVPKTAPESIVAADELEIILRLDWDEPREVLGLPDVLQYVADGELPAGFETAPRAIEAVSLTQSPQCPSLPDVDSESGYTRQMYRGAELEIELFFRIVSLVEPGSLCIKCSEVQIPEVTVRGLTSEPLVLRNAWSIRPHEHHHGGWFGTFLTPLLDPCVSGVQKDEWRAAGYEGLYVFQPFPTGLLSGYEGEWRDGFAWMFHADTSWSEIPVEFVPEPAARLAAVACILALALLGAGRRARAR